MKFVKFIYIFWLFLAASWAFEDWEVEEFAKYEIEFSKSYSSESERSRRIKIFLDNLNEIKRYNFHRKSTYFKGINDFTDLTDEEFEKTYLGYAMRRGKRSKELTISKMLQDYLPKSVNWSDKGALSDVKNQGNCSSSWAFTSVAQIESYLKIENDILPKLSTQHLISCSKDAYKCKGNNGCFKSISEVGYVYASLYGVALEHDYPYTSGNTSQIGICNRNSFNKVAMVQGYESLPSNKMYTVMKHLAEVGPLSVAVAASSFKSYKEGVFSGCPFDRNIVINHAVQLVGFGKDTYDGDYWLIRNSWGTNWGENGFMRMKRFPNIKCGINYDQEFKSSCHQKEQAYRIVCGNCGILFDANFPINANLF